MEIIKGKKIGCVMTGSFCTFQETFCAWQTLIDAGAELYPIMSYNAYDLDTRFFKAEDSRTEFSRITGREVWHTIPQVEPIGPKALFDLLIVAPCTGNTLAKIASGITDTPAALSVKSHLRNARPVLLSISTNDGLAQAARNIGTLMPTKNVFFVPFRQDDHSAKPTSLVADLTILDKAAAYALQYKQIQPVLLG